MQGLLNFWDVLTPQNLDLIKREAKTPFQVARSKWGRDGGKYDAQAHPKNVYTIGHNPNEKGPERGSLSVPPELTDSFIKEYLPKMESEIAVGKLGKNGEVRNSKIEQIFNWMEKSGNYPQQVIEALRDKEKELIKFAAYELLGWLNTPHLGIKDEKYHLLDDLTEGDVDEKANREARMQRVYNFVTSMSQIPMGMVPPRRKRAGMGIMGGNTNKEGETYDVATGTTNSNKKNLGAKFAQLHSDPGTLPRAGWKTHKMFEKMTDFLSTYRNNIINKLNNSEMADKDLENSQDKIEVALQAAQNLYVKYNNELKSTFPDDQKREEEVMKKVHQELPNAIKKLSGEISPIDQESILAKIKGMGDAVKLTAHSPQLLEKARSAYDEFLNKLTLADYDDEDGVHLPIYDPANNEFVDSTNTKWSLENFAKNNPGKIIEFIKTVYNSFPQLQPEALKVKGPDLYTSVQEEYGDKRPEKEIKEEYFNTLNKAEAQSQSPNTPSAPAPAAPQAAQHQPMSMAAKSIDDLINTAPNFNSRKELEQIINNIFARKQEFLKNPAEAAKLGKMEAAIRARSQIVDTQEKLQPQDYLLLKNLGKFVGDIHNELDL